LFPNELPYLLQCQRQIIFLQKKGSLEKLPESVEAVRRIIGKPNRGS
jgi:hypothetical protein